VGTGDRELALDDGGVGHRSVDMPVRKPPWQNRALRMTEGGHDLEAKARVAARRIDVEQLAVQVCNRLDRLARGARARISEIVRKILGKMLEVGMD